MRTTGGRELIPFSTAVSDVYKKVTRTAVPPFAGLVTDALLNEVAQAMADLVTIYGAPNENLPIKPLRWAEIKLGIFQRSAEVLRTNDGIEYLRLYIRRADVLAAASVLKKSRARFAGAADLQATVNSAEVRSEAA